MIQYSRIGVLLLVAIATGLGAVPAVHAEEDPVAQADLVLTKALDAEGPVYAGDQLVWVLTLTNNGPDGATGIEVTEDMAGLGEYTLDGSDPSEGTSYEDPVWTVPALANGAAATLTLTTTIAGEGDVTNLATITAVDQEDPDASNNVASASTEAGPSTTAEITIRPETLNLRSRGVFTVFIKFDEDYPLSGIDLGKSSLLCNGAEPKKLHVTQKDGGTVMAKYRRQDLVDVVAGEEVTITCEGTIVSGEETVRVTGSDTIRVIGEKKKGFDAFFAGILDTVLPMEDEEDAAAGDVTATPTPAASQEQAKNRGQLKKAERNGDGTCTGDCPNADSTGGKGNGKKSGKDDDSVTGSRGKGNQDGNGNPADTGAGNGKGNGNKPDTDKGNGKGKK